MPGLNMSFKAAAGGGGRMIKANPVSIGAYGMEINNETAHFGGNTGPIMNKRVETAAPPVKARAGGTKSGGMFG